MYRFYLVAWRGGGVTRNFEITLLVPFTCSSCTFCTFLIASYFAIQWVPPIQLPHSYGPNKN